jgi:hypothetical protein
MTTIDHSLARQALAPPGRLASPTAATREADPLLSFETVVDAVNPLQHLPVVSTLYRSATGDGIGGVARLAGGLIFGGPLGLLAGAATVALEAVTGTSVEEQAKTMAGHVAEALSGKGEEEPAPAPTLPWLAAAPADAGSEAGLPSEAVTERALARAAEPAETSGADPQAAAEQPADPATVARLYALESTRPGGRSVGSDAT